MAGADPSGLPPDEVRRLFELVLGRPPESEAVVAHYAAMPLGPAAFVRLLMDSEEVAERYRRRLALLALGGPGEAATWPAAPPGATRALLFGAYGNGNLGDAAQAEALAWLLAEILPGPLAIAATSWERRAPYPLAGGTVFPPDALLRATLLPGGGRGLVAIGGGGLLGAPHFPLHAEAWVDWLARQGVPWALLGVGGSAGALAEPAWRAAYGKLIAGAAFVGVRDAETLAAARAINPAARWFPDPILARALCTPAGASARVRPVDALVIPRTPNGAADRATNRAALEYATALRGGGGRVVVVGMEEVLDRAHFGAADLTYVDRWEALDALCRESRVVLSSRLHGAIAGLVAGCVVHGLLQPKIGDLMVRLGVGAWFAADGWPALEPDGSDEALAAFRSALAPGLARMRADLAEAMAAAATALRAA